MTRLAILGVALLAVTACDCSDDGDPPGTGMDASSGTTDAGPRPDSGTLADGQVNDLCPEGCVCADGIDNDGDGLIDGMDPECTGPFDNDEGSFATGIPGDNRDPMWQDCFFDGNSGAGDDGCRYRTECLTGDIPLDDPQCSVTQGCIDFCQARTPNGCDCFGCCEIFTGTETLYVTLSATCSLDEVENETACPRCVQTTDCYNECGTCELCPGRTLEDLPPECYDEPDGGMPMYTCDNGITCMSDADCPETASFCSLGCCLAGPD